MLLQFITIKKFLRFLNDRREKVRSENPTMPFSEITKQLAAEWNTLPTDQKQVNIIYRNLRNFK